MSEVKDPAIKLFGRTISFPLEPCLFPNDSSGPPPPPDHLTLPSSSLSDEYTSERDQEPSRKEVTSEQDDGASHQTTEDLKSPTSSGVSEKPKTPSSSAEGDTSLLEPSKDGQQSETSTVQEKAPKKPDKILQCPRCNSMDTKFCYYNNYNVNQPRHFCKNCQRYWTAGGTMRNVPVGAGRRKNKSPCASHYRHIMVPESLLMAKTNVANGLHNTFVGNGVTVLTFGSNSPICDSMASVLNLDEKAQNGALNGFHVREQDIIVSCGREDNIHRDDHSNGASVTTSTSSEKRTNASSQESVDKSYEAFPPQLQCIPGSPWHYPWNPMQLSSSMLPPVFCPPGYPVSIYPTPTYWGSTLPASWNIPCISPQASVNHSSPSSGSNSPTLGKHSRDGSVLTPANSQKENGVLIPKTLRIDDPSEAEKSSIWSTLGIKNEKANSLNGGGRAGLFKAFLSRGDGKNHHHLVEASPVLQANPAALARAVAFQEQQT